jgi:hypothetical protein
MEDLGAHGKPNVSSVKRFPSQLSERCDCNACGLPSQGVTTANAAAWLKSFNGPYLGCGHVEADADRQTIAYRL